MGLLLLLGAEELLSDPETLDQLDPGGADEAAGPAFDAVQDPDGLRGLQVPGVQGLVEEGGGKPAGAGAHAAPAADAGILVVMLRLLLVHEKDA